MTGKPGHKSITGSSENEFEIVEITEADIIEATIDEVQIILNEGMMWFIDLMEDQ